MTSLNKKFVRDMGLPISVLEDPYFSYLIKLYDSQFDSIKKYNIFKDLVNRKGESGFSDLTRHIIDSSVDFVSKRESFIEFSNSKLTKEQLDLLNSIRQKTKKKDLYKQDNANQKYVSVDMASANFQAIQHFNSDIFGGKSSFPEFLSMFTDEEYFLMSKQVRQVILGSLNPKATRNYTQYLMATICQDLLNAGIPEECFLILSNDELIFVNDDNKHREIFETFCAESKFNLHLEFFTLELVYPERSFFSKTFEDGTFSLKCVPSKNYAEVFKYRLGLELNNEMDLAFEDDGRVSFFKEPILK